MKLLLVNILLVTIAFANLALAERLRVNQYTHSRFSDYKYKLHREPDVNLYNLPENDDENVATKWITQPLDHFNPQDSRTFQMRYMENDQYLQQDGPIFIFVGGEWTISNSTLLVGHMHDMARDLNGMLYYTEHRYYGQTRPTDDLTTENLQYLNIDQALADLAHFIDEIKTSDPRLANSGVIIVGCSYSATMVTWFMQKYPHLANGAWASSAPLQAKVDFTEYKEVVAAAIEEVGGEECARRIRSAISQFEEWAMERNGPKIEESMSLCHPINFDHHEDVENLFSAIAGGWSGIVQYHREQRQTIQRECELLNSLDLGSDALNYGYWYWSYDYENGNFDVCLNHLLEEDIAFFNQTSWNSGAGRSEWRQWYYQTCAEYGWYQTSGNNTLFGSSFSVDNSLKICELAYGENFVRDRVHANADRTNYIYGALDPTVNRVYSVHGAIDPWASMGVKEDINVMSPTTICPLEAHCPDLTSIHPDDLEVTRQSKERIFELIIEWLGLDYQPTTPTTPAPTETETPVPETTTEEATDAPVTDPETTTEETTDAPVTDPETTTEETTDAPVTDPETTTEEATDAPVTDPETTTEEATDAPVTDPSTTEETETETTNDES